MVKGVRRLAILGAAGRDFHNFNTTYRDDPSVEIVAFTATQIPGIAGRRYPAELAGPRYPNGIRIVPEDDLERLIRNERVDICVFSYSDVSHETVMHLASRCIVAGADFKLLSNDRTMIPSMVPVIAITAVRTGAGKSQTTRYVSSILKKMGKKVVAIRHPMPYGDLAEQACQRFAAYSDLDMHKCTIEEREEYEPHIDNGFIIYSGVDYGQILKAAEEEAEVILWDGGNNDLPFYRPDVHICIADPLRPGHEMSYHPGEANFRRADVILINKCDSAEPKAIESIEANAARVNPKARILRANSPATCDKPEMVKGKRVLVIEDGPTLTHGGMTYGAGVVAAKRNGRGRDRRPDALRRRLHQGDLREVPERPRDPAGDGVQRAADRRARGHDREDPVRPRPRRDADRPDPRPEDRQAGGTRPLRARAARPRSPRGGDPEVRPLIP